jgi:hypothetical protein
LKNNAEFEESTLSAGRSVLMNARLKPHLRETTQGQGQIETIDLVERESLSSLN